MKPIARRELELRRRLRGGCITDYILEARLVGRWWLLPHENDCSTGFRLYLEVR